MLILLMLLAIVAFYAAFGLLILFSERVIHPRAQPGEPGGTRPGAGR